MKQQIDEIYKRDSRGVFATLVRLLGDFDLAEEALHEAFTAALDQWEREGIPKNPSAWLISTGRFKAIDALRRRSTYENVKADLIERAEASVEPDMSSIEKVLEDDQLRMIFVCCHPVLPDTTQVAMTLREVCGLSTEEIAKAFMLSPATVAQRIVRGKAKIRDSKVPFEVPEITELAERLESVLSVIYLVFNEGYSASSGDQALRADLSAEAIRLGRLLVVLLPDPEAVGLLALMLLHDSRRAARTDSQGDLILLEHQDRTLWNKNQLLEGKRLIEAIFEKGQVGIYSIQAAISAVHADADKSENTNWSAIVALYDLLLQASYSPVVELNRAVAVAMRDGPEAGLKLIDQIIEKGELPEYHLTHAAQADLHRRLKNVDAAKAAYEKALSLARQEPERRYYLKCLENLQK